MLSGLKPCIVLFENHEPNIQKYAHLYIGIYLSIYLAS